MTNQINDNFFNFFLSSLTDDKQLLINELESEFDTYSRHLTPIASITT